MSRHQAGGFFHGMPARLPSAAPAARHLSLTFRGTPGGGLPPGGCVGSCPGRCRRRWRPTPPCAAPGQAPRCLHLGSTRIMQAGEQLLHCGDWATCRAGQRREAHWKEACAPAHSPSVGTATSGTPSTGASSSSSARSPPVKPLGWLGSCLLVCHWALANACRESGCSRYCRPRRAEHNSGSVGSTRGPARARSVHMLACLMRRNCAPSPVVLHSRDGQSQQHGKHARVQAAM